MTNTTEKALKNPVTCPNYFIAAAKLTEYAVRGLTCVSMTSKGSRVTLTFAPTPAGEPLRIYRVLDKFPFAQSAGWDYAYFDGKIIYVSLLLIGLFVSHARLFRRKIAKKKKQRDCRKDQDHATSK